MTANSHTPLSLGFIGGGMSSAIGQTHFSASQLDGRWQLKAGAFSRHPDVNARTAEAWHVAPERTFENWQDMIEHEADQLDAVAVLTPTPAHVDVVCALLKRGIPVICEKALAASPGEAATIRSAFESRPTNFMAVTYNYSGYPMVRELRRFIQNGGLGRIQQVHVEMPQEGFSRPPVGAGPQPWRLHDGDVPTICLDLGVHLHHLVYFLTGLEPFETMADFSTYSNYPVIDNAMIWLNYPEGVKGSIWISKTAIGYRNGLRLRIFGEKGSAEWYQMDPETFQLSFNDGSRQTVDRGGNAPLQKEARYNRFKAGHPSGFIEAFANLYWDMADALTDYRGAGSHNNPYVYGLDHAELGLKLFSAAVQSNISRNWQTVFPAGKQQGLLRTQGDECHV